MNDMSQLQSIEKTILLNDEERQPCEIWTRVMGYHRPVSSYNLGKKGEYYERKFFDEKRAGLGPAQRREQEDASMAGALL
ncbi:MAG: hypothetical protein DI537_59665 [Stutzerimonas stutzeri]|nr:MAG: hypothetical protein DI537_59665 [Stutzerimonas stutzeri]